MASLGSTRAKPLESYQSEAISNRIHDEKRDFPEDTTEFTKKKFANLDHPGHSRMASETFVGTSSGPTGSKECYTMEGGGSFTELALGLMPVKPRASYSESVHQQESAGNKEDVDMKQSATEITQSPSKSFDINGSTLGATLANSLKLISTNNLPEPNSPDMNAHSTSALDDSYCSYPQQSDQNVQDSYYEDTYRPSSVENSPVLTISHDNPTDLQKKASLKKRSKRSIEKKGKKSPPCDDEMKTPVRPLRKRYARKSKEKNKESVAEPTSEMDGCVMLFQCEVCYKVFNRKQTLRQHFITHTDRFACSFCNMRCKSKGDLRTHIQTHTKEKPYHCEVCNTNYTRESILKKHVNTQIHKKALLALAKRTKSGTGSSKPVKEVSVPEKSLFGGLSCSSCNKVFLSQKQLRKHLRVHLLKYKCQECNKRCLSPALLSLHMKCHYKSHSLTCNMCSRSFSNIFLLKEHKKVHRRLSAAVTNQKLKQEVLKAAVKHHNRKVDETSKKIAKWLCQQCGKSYVSERTLENHLKTHEDLKCSMCNKSYPSLSKLSLHMKFHIKPHTCDTCNISFLDIDEFHQHTEAEHVLELDLKCKICFKQFSTNDELEVHMTNHAPTMLFSGASLDESSIPTAHIKTKKNVQHSIKQLLNSDGEEGLPFKKSLEESDNETFLNIESIERVLSEALNELKEDQWEEEDVEYSSDEELFSRIKRTLESSDLVSSDDSDGEDKPLLTKPAIYDHADIERKHSGVFAIHEEVNLVDKTFKCKLCCLFFAGCEDLREHLISHVCEFCNLFFVDKTDLASHRGEHKDQVLRDIKSESRRSLPCSKYSMFNSDGSDSEIDEESDGFLSELETVLNCNPSGQKSRLRPLAHDDIIRVNKKTFDRYSCIDPNNNIYACTICKRKYARPTTLTRHLKTHVCPYCNLFFEDKVDLLEHKYRHRKASTTVKTTDEIVEKERVLASPLITKINRDLFKKYTLVDKENKINRCTLCCKNFVRRTVLTRHMKTHICSVCDKFYEDKYDLAKHQASHREQYKYTEDDLPDYSTCVEKPLQSPCQDDGKLVSLAPSLSNISHFGSAYPVQNSTSGENQTLTFIQLPETGETTAAQMFTATAPGGSTFQIISEPDTNPASFLVTSSTGSGGEPGKIISISQPVVEERLYQCGDCSKHFFKEDHLKDHLVVHSKAKPYVCHLCGKAFTRATAMRKHEKTHMKRCKICDTAFSYKYELDLHMEMHRTYTF